MKRWQKYLVITHILALGFLPACGGSGADTAPNQEEFNQALTALVDFTSQVFAGFFAITDCNQFNDLLAGLPTEFSCADGGKLIIQIGERSCEPPLEAFVSIAYSFEDCEEPDNTIEGNIVANFSSDGTSSVVSLTASAIQFDGFGYTWEDFVITYDTTGTPACSGQLFSGGVGCTAAADCSECTL